VDGRAGRRNRPYRRNAVKNPSDVDKALTISELGQAIK
jgi:hypothetical protein